MKVNEPRLLQNILLDVSTPQVTSDSNELKSSHNGLLFWGTPVVVCIGIAAIIGASGLNIPIFLFIQRAVGYGSAAFWQSVTMFGNGLVALVLCALWLRGRPAAIWAALLGAIPAALVSRVLKMVIDVPRPAAVLLDEVHFLGPAFRHASFPSGHALTAFLIAGIACSVHRSASARLVILTAASLVALSRIVVGLHWPIDVLCGAAAGWVSAHAGLVGARRWPIARWKVAPVVLVVLIFAASLTLFYLEMDLPLANPVRYTVAAAGCVLCAFALIDILKGSPFAADVTPWFAAASFSIPIRTLALCGLSLIKYPTLRSRGSEEGDMQVSHSSKRGAWMPTFEPGVIGFILLTSTVNVVLFHWPLYRLAISSLSAIDRHGLLALLTLVVLQSVVSITILGLAALVSIRLLKPMCILFAFGNAIALYFIAQYGIIIDATLSGNVLNTSFGEARELAHPKMLLYLALFGLVPAAVVARVQVRASSRARIAAFAAVSLALGLAWSYTNAQTSLWIDKNAKQFGGLVLPWSYLVNPVRHYLDEAASKREPELLPPLTTTDPRRVVFILVIGEAARAQNFSLYGYGRETNPLLAGAGVIAFPGATSCATYTTASLRCMLSYRGTDSSNEEPLPSYLYRHGVEVIWRTNNFGEPPLKVSRLQHADQLRRQCAGDCARMDFDEVLLQGLAAHLASTPEPTKTLVVLHQAGSHGPQYSKKYPPEFERFKPTCQTVELQKCSKEELVNAYDNTILYTDYLLNGVIELLKALKGTASVMLYMSDHGESLGENGLYLHGIPTSIAPDVQTSVPLIVWMSDEFLQRRGASRPGLIAVPRLSPDVVFHTVMGALGLTSKIYEPQQDLLRDLQPLGSTSEK